MIMDVLASLMFYLKQYDYIIFPIVVAMIAVFQFKQDKRSALVLWSLSVIYTIDALLGSRVFNDVSTFYKFNVVVNCFVLLILLLQKGLMKKVITCLMCFSIILMNLYEHVNPYQTAIYPYIDTIHSWYLELLVLTVLINFKAHRKL